ncbi:uncharacterized protein LOC144473827 [Augochlora pura]
MADDDDQEEFLDVEEADETVDSPSEVIQITEEAETGSKSPSLVSETAQPSVKSVTEGSQISGSVKRGSQLSGSIKSGSPRSGSAKGSVADPGSKDSRKSHETFEEPSKSDEVISGSKELSLTEKQSSLDHLSEKKDSVQRTKLSKWQRQCNRQFRDMIGKREQKNEELERQKGDIRQRLNILECSMPAVMVWNIWRMAQGSNSPCLQQVLEKQFQGPASGEVYCPNTPSRHFDCRVREAEAERKQAVKRAEEARAMWAEKMASLEDRETRLQEAKRLQEEQQRRIEQLTSEVQKLRESKTADDGGCEAGECGAIECKKRWLDKVPSSASIRSTDIECLEKLQELAQAELNMKRQIADLERREEAYMRTLQQADELWCKAEEDAAIALEEKATERQQMAGRIGELEDEVEKLRARLKTCRGELEKYVSIGKIEALIGRDDDFADVRDSEASAGVDVKDGVAGRDDDDADIKGTSLKDASMEVVPLEDALATGAVVRPGELAETTVTEIRGYLDQIASLSELEGPGMLCGLDFDCNDAELTHTGLPEEERIALEENRVTARELLEMYGLLEIAEQLMPGGEAELKMSRRVEGYIEDVTETVTLVEDTEETVQREIVYDEEKEPVLDDEVLQESEEIVYDQEVSEGDIVYEDALEEEDAIAEYAKTSEEDQEPDTLKPAGDVLVPLEQLCSWQDHVHSIRSKIVDCPSCNAVDGEAEIVAEELAAYTGRTMKLEVAYRMPPDEEPEAMEYEGGALAVEEVAIKYAEVEEEIEREAEPDVAAAEIEEREVEPEKPVVEARAPEEVEEGVREEVEAEVERVEERVPEPREEARPVEEAKVERAEPVAVKEPEEVDRRPKEEAERPPKEEIREEEAERPPKEEVIKEEVDRPPKEEAERPPKEEVREEEAERPPKEEFREEEAERPPKEEIPKDEAERPPKEEPEEPEPTVKEEKVVEEMPKEERPPETKEPEEVPMVAKEEVRETEERKPELLVKEEGVKPEEMPPEEVPEMREEEDEETDFDELVSEDEKVEEIHVEQLEEFEDAIEVDIIPMEKEPEEEEEESELEEVAPVEEEEEPKEIEMEVIVVEAVSEAEIIPEEIEMEELPPEEELEIKPEEIIPEEKEIMVLVVPKEEPPEEEIIVDVSVEEAEEEIEAEVPEMEKIELEVEVLEDAKVAVEIEIAPVEVPEEPKEIEISIEEECICSGILAMEHPVIEYLFPPLPVTEEESVCQCLVEDETPVDEEDSGECACSTGGAPAEEEESEECQCNSGAAPVEKEGSSVSKSASEGPSKAPKKSSPSIQKADSGGCRCRLKTPSGGSKTPSSGSKTPSKDSKRSSSVQKRDFGVCRCKSRTPSDGSKRSTPSVQKEDSDVCRCRLRTPSGGSKDSKRSSPSVQKEDSGACRCRSKTPSKDSKRSTVSSVKEKDVCTCGLDRGQPRMEVTQTEITQTEVTQTEITQIEVNTLTIQAVTQTVTDVGMQTQPPSLLRQPQSKMGSRDIERDTVERQTRRKRSIEPSRMTLTATSQTEKSSFLRILQSLKTTGASAKADPEKELRSINYGKKTEDTEARCNCCLCGKDTLQDQKPVEAPTSSVMRLLQALPLLSKAATSVDQGVQHESFCQQCKIKRLQRSADGTTMREPKQIQTTRDQEVATARSTLKKSSSRQKRSDDSVMVNIRVEKSPKRKPMEKRLSEVAEEKPERRSDVRPENGCSVVDDEHCVCNTFGVAGVKKMRCACGDPD